MSQWDPIPGETPIDLSGLIPKGVTSRAVLNVAEARNIAKALVKYLAGRPGPRQAPFTLHWLYVLHRDMFGNVWQWAGKRRNSELNLGVPYYQIDTDLQDMLDNLLYWRDHNSMPVIEQAARLHHRAVHIHPFLNGNGRWARLLANIWLRQMRHPLVDWPEPTMGRESAIRKQYINAIQAADVGNYTPLIDLHRQFSGTMNPDAPTV